MNSSWNIIQWLLLVSSLLLNKVDHVSCFAPALGCHGRFSCQPHSHSGHVVAPSLARQPSAFGLAYKNRSDVELIERPTLLQQEETQQLGHQEQDKSTASALPSIQQQQQQDEEEVELITAISLTADDVIVSSPEDEEEDERQKNINMARLLLIGAAALYGTNFSIVKLLGQTDMSIALSATLRFGLAAVVTSPWLFGASESPSEDGKDHRLEVTLRGMEVGAWNSIGYIAQAVGLESTLASKSAFLCSLAVVIVPLLDFATGKRMESRQMVGILLALVGVAVLELGGLSASELTLTSGDLASMLQPLAFGVAFWRMEKTMHKYPNEAKRATAAQLLAVLMGSASYGAVTSPESFHMDAIMNFVSQPTILFSLFWTGCITTALTIYMESMALKSLSAAETTLILSTEPLWGTAFAAVVLGEQLGVDTGIGTFLIISACLFSNLGWTGIQNLILGSTSSSSSDEKIKNSNNVTKTDETETTQVSDLARTGFLAATGSSLLGALEGFGLVFEEVAIALRVAAEEVLEFFGGTIPPGPPDL